MVGLGGTGFLGLREAGEGEGYGAREGGGGVCETGRWEGSHRRRQYITELEGII